MQPIGSELNEEEEGYNESYIWYVYVLWFSSRMASGIPCLAVRTKKVKHAHFVYADTSNVSNVFDFPELQVSVHIHESSSLRNTTYLADVDI